MENPTYKRAFNIFKSFSYQVEIVGMDENGMKVEELRKKQVSVAYVMPSHQFPTGVTMPIGRRMELLKWASEEDGRYLIEDDYDSEFRYRGKPIPSLQGADAEEKVIYIGTFSKAIAPAIRISFMVLPPRLLAGYLRDCYFYSCTVSRIDQRILNEFIKDGYFERYLNKSRKLYREKHDLLLQELKPFLRKFKITGEHAGLHLLLTCRNGKDLPKLSERELIRKAAEVGVKVYGLSDSYVEQELSCNAENHSGSDENSRSGNQFVTVFGSGLPTVMLGYGGLKKEEITEGIQKLKQVWL
jgi:GntR family transcriptional regulator/MocR family aminotransferase